MTISLLSTFVPHTDGERAIAFYRDVLGFEVRADVDFNDMRWITLGAPGLAATVVLYPGSAEQIVKEGYPAVEFASTDLDADFARIEASGATIRQAPTAQPYGATNCEFEDPAGNFLRMQQA
ncbi:VOC family protein [Micrococcales bacterium 31B]|nr:VOC family protein [Micrococcales bacterium 31B]